MSSQNAALNSDDPKVRIAELRLAHDQLSLSRGELVSVIIEIAPQFPDVTGLPGEFAYNLSELAAVGHEFAALSFYFTIRRINLTLAGGLLYSRACPSSWSNQSSIGCPPARIPRFLCTSDA